MSAPPSVYHRFPSGPAAISYGLIPKLKLDGVAGYSVIDGVAARAALAHSVSSSSAPATAAVRRLATAPAPALRVLASLMKGRSLSVPRRAASARRLSGAADRRQAQLQSADPIGGRLDPWIAQGPALGQRERETAELAVGPRQVVLDLRSLDRLPRSCGGALGSLFDPVDHVDPLRSRGASSICSSRRILGPAEPASLRRSPHL